MAVVIHTIKSNQYAYNHHREGKKVISDYLGRAGGEGRINKGTDIYQEIETRAPEVTQQIERQPLTTSTAETRREFLKPSRTPQIHYNADRTLTMGRDIYIGKDLPDESKKTFLDHEMLHVSFYDYEDLWMKKGIIKDVGQTEGLKDHPMYSRYSDREKGSEDFVDSAGQWISGKRFDYGIRRGWITKEQAESRMAFFDEQFNKKVTQH